MAEKVTWTELRRILATRAGVSEKKAGAFLNALQVQLVEALKQDKQVKLNGLGTFKLQAVAPRKSVNVTTGEEIIIEGYNKLAFTPEAGVKELVEKGEPTSGERLAMSEVIDPIQKLGAQAEEIVDILGELGQRPGDNGERLAVSEEPKEEPKEEPEKVVAPEPEPVKVVEPEPEPKKKHHFLRDTLICVVILLMLLAGAYFFLRHELSHIIQSLIQPEETEVVVSAVEEPIIEAEEEATETVVAVEEVVVPEEDIRVYKDFLLTEEIAPGSRLAWIAKKHYGNKIYWPYLYDANKDHLSHPSQIAVGTPIRVPRLTEAQLDTTSAQFNQLRQEAEEACKK